MRRMDDWPVSPLVVATAEQDARNDALFEEIIDRNVEALWTYFSQERDEVAEALLREHLPFRLHGLLGHQRLLNLALRVRPKWKPTFLQLQGYTTKSAAEQFGQTWLREVAERGKAQPNVGVIYTQPDAMQKAIAVHA
jgi:hypothetical protein